MQIFGGFSVNRVGERWIAGQSLHIRCDQAGGPAADDGDGDPGGEGAGGEGGGESTEEFLAVAAEEVADEEEQGCGVGVGSGVEG